MRKKAISFMLGVISMVMSAVFFANYNSVQATGPESAPKVSNASMLAPLNSFATNLFDELGLSRYNLDEELFQRALVGYYNLKAEGAVNEKKQILSIVDFRKNSTEKRLWVIDIANKKVLYHSLVAHGRNSGDNTAHTFSNINQSNMSSLGFYVTGNTYIGKHGLSLTLDGKEAGFNSNARSRAVVVHGANYVSEKFIKAVGRLGRSQGCPAIPEEIAPEVIKDIANGTVLFLYYPDQRYEAKTRYKNLELANQMLGGNNTQVSMVQDENTVENTDIAPVKETAPTKVAPKKEIKAKTEAEVQSPKKVVTEPVVPAEVIVD